MRRFVATAVKRASPLTLAEFRAAVDEYATDATLSQVVAGSSEKARMLLAEMPMGLAKAQALAAPELFQVKQALAEKTTPKLLAAIVEAFCDSVRVPNRPDDADIIEVADVFTNTHPHDSIKDFILGRVFKNAEH